MSNKSKTKGNNFERVVAKLLSETYKDIYKVDDAFQRNISSGSIFGGTNKRDTLQETMIYVGDIITPNDFKYVIECKHYATPFTINALITQNCSQLDKWISQVTHDSEVASKKPILIVKYNNIKPFCLVKDNFGIPVFIYKGWFAYDFEQFLLANKELLSTN